MDTLHTALFVNTLVVVGFRYEDYFATRVLCRSSVREMICFFLEAKKHKFRLKKNVHRLVIHEEIKIYYNYWAVIMNVHGVKAGVTQEGRCAS